MDMPRVEEQMAKTLKAFQAVEGAAEEHNKTVADATKKYESVVNTARQEVVKLHGMLGETEAVQALQTAGIDIPGDVGGDGGA